MCYLCEQAEQVKTGTTENWDPSEEFVSLAKLADAVRKAAISNPNKVYQRQVGFGCKYTHGAENGQGFVPGCIVGQGIFDLTGKVVDNTRMMGAVDNDRWKLALKASDGEQDAYGDLVLKDDPMTRYLVHWLRAVQAQQDDGVAWGRAVKFADDNVGFSTYAS